MEVRSPLRRRGSGVTPDLGWDPEGLNLRSKGESQADKFSQRLNANSEPSHFLIGIRFIWNC